MNRELWIIVHVREIYLLRLSVNSWNGLPHILLHLVQYSVMVVASLFEFWGIKQYSHWIRYRWLRKTYTLKSHSPWDACPWQVNYPEKYISPVPPFIHTIWMESGAVKVEQTKNYRNKQTNKRADYGCDWVKTVLISTVLLMQSLKKMVLARRLLNLKKVKSNCVLKKENNRLLSNNYPTVEVSKVLIYCMCIESRLTKALCSENLPLIFVSRVTVRNNEYKSGVVFLT